MIVMTKGWMCRFGPKGGGRKVAEASAGGAADSGLPLFHPEAGGQAGAAAAASGFSGKACGHTGAQDAAPDPGGGAASDWGAPAGGQRLPGRGPPHAAAEELCPQCWLEDCHLCWCVYP